MKAALISVFCFLTAITGCGGNGQYDPSTNKLYSINIDIPKPATEPKTLSKIKVREFTISEQFNTRNMILLVDDNQYVKDYYSQFMVSPAIMITDLTAGWLDKQNVLGSVLPVDSVVDSDYLIEGNILKLYGDFKQLDNPKAVMQIQFYVIDTSRRKTDLLFEKVYFVSQPLENNTSDQLIEGYRKAFEKLLSDFTEDVVKIKK